MTDDLKYENTMLRGRIVERDELINQLTLCAGDYFDRYVQDEAYDIECCVAGEQQHIDAVALRSAVTIARGLGYGVKI